MSQGQNFLPKFLFVSNLLKAVKIRQRVPIDVVKPAASGGLMHHLRGMHRYTLEMIAMNHFPQAFREVVQAAILDRAMQASLEQEKKLNWCREVKKMVPLRTNGKKDGHVASDERGSCSFCCFETFGAWYQELLPSSLLGAEHTF